MRACGPASNSAAASSAPIQSLDSAVVTVRSYTVAVQATLLWGLLFSSIGLGFAIYGRRQQAVVPLLCGVALMVFPYFVSNVMLLVGIGVLLVAVPYFLRR